MLSLLSIVGGSVATASLIARELYGAPTNLAEPLRLSAYSIGRPPRDKHGEIDMLVIGMRLAGAFALAMQPYQKLGISDAQKQHLALVDVIKANRDYFPGYAFFVVTDAGSLTESAMTTRIPATGEEATGIIEVKETVSSARLIAWFNRARESVDMPAARSPNPGSKADGFDLHV